MGNLLYDSAGIVGIATGGESTYGAGDALTHVMYLNAPATVITPTQFDKGTLATGYEERTGYVIQGWQTRQPFSGPVCDLSLPIHLAFGLGSDSPSTLDTTCIQHAISVDSFATNPASTEIGIRQGDSIAEATAGQAIEHNGCVVDSFSLSGSRDSGIWTFSSDWITDGNNSAGYDDVTSLTKPSLLPYIWGGTQVVITTTLPTAYTVDAPTSADAGAGVTGGWSSTTDISASVLSVDYSLQNLISTSNIANSDGTISRVWRNGREQTVTLNTLWDDGTAVMRNWAIWGAKAVGQSYEIGMIIYNMQSTLAGASTHYYGFALAFPKMTLTSVSAPTGNPRVMSTTWTVCKDTANSLASVYAHAWNKDNVTYC